MEVETVGRSTERPAALDAQTACEALQATAAAHPDRTAIRTRNDEFSCTWGEYAERVSELAAGLASMGVKRGDDGCPDAQQPARVPSRRFRGHAPRRRALLDLQHLHEGADRAPAGRRRQSRGDHGAGAPGHRSWRSRTTSTRSSTSSLSTAIPGEARSRSRTWRLGGIRDSTSRRRGGRSSPTTC